MTIDEYLSQGAALKEKAKNAETHLRELETKMLNARSSLNLGDGIGANRRNVNGTEERLIEYLDAGKAYTAALKELKQFRHQLQSTSDFLLHWEGKLIEEIYIYNTFFDRDFDYNVREILRTDDQRTIDKKTSEAKQHFADLLRAQGVTIE